MLQCPCELLPASWMPLMSDLYRSCVHADATPSAAHLCVSVRCGYFCLLGSCDCWLPIQQTAIGAHVAFGVHICVHLHASWQLPALAGSARYEYPWYVPSTLPGGIAASIPPDFTLRTHPTHSVVIGSSTRSRRAHTRSGTSKPPLGASAPASVLLLEVSPLSCALQLERKNDTSCILR